MFMTLAVVHSFSRLYRIPQHDLAPVYLFFIFIRWFPAFAAGTRYLWLLSEWSYPCPVVPFLATMAPVGGHFLAIMAPSGGL